MPTPESEAFLARKPKVAPTYEGVDFSDFNQVLAARDAILREQWIRFMMQRLVGEELGKCYRREGVNHLEKCGKYRDRYLQLLKDNKEKGYLGKERNYVPGVNGPAGGPEIPSSFPTPQQALGIKGTDRRKGNDTGYGDGAKLY
ncbi:hypothetical protein DV737_g3462, partial [Chaetothyriales sp. CBS 132003]